MSSKVLQDFLDQSGSLVQDGMNALKPDDLKSAVDSAKETYSRHRTRRVVIDLVGDGTGVFNVSDLTGYVEEFSGDPEIEFPISTSGEPNPMDRRAWIWYRHPTEGLQIRMIEDKPSASQSARFTFPVIHAIGESDAAETTIPDTDFYAFCKLVAAEELDQLAQFFTQTGEGTEVTIGGATFYQSKAGEYEKRAKKYRAQYDSHIGIGRDAEVGAASVTKNLDLPASSGLGRVTHPARRR